MGNSMAQKPCISCLGKLRTLIVATVVIFGATLFAVTAHVQDAPVRTLLVFAAPSLTDALEALQNTII
jgi:ABC-type molybdate transport system substrate-binding protein